MEDDLKELLRHLMDGVYEYSDWTALHIAAEDGDKRNVELLLKYGARVRHKEWWCTPLELAVKSYDLRMRRSNVLTKKANDEIRKDAQKVFPDIIRMLEEAEAKLESNKRE